MEQGTRYFSRVEGTSVDVRLPQRATPNSAGYDFYLPETVTISPGEIILMKSGVTAHMEKDEYLQLQGRSSLALKYGLTFVNGVGIIDSDYEGKEIGFIFINHGSQSITLESGTRVAQGIFLKYYTIEDDEPLSAERTGGFGSTGSR